MTPETFLDILSTDQALLTQLKALFQHQQSCIASRHTQSLQESNTQMDAIAAATEENNLRKAQFLQAAGITASDDNRWEAVAGMLITRLPAIQARAAEDLLATVKVLADECRKLCRDNQKTMVMQMTLTGKMLNRLRGPAIDNGSAYSASGYTSQASDSLSLAIA